MVIASLRSRSSCSSVGGRASTRLSFWQWQKNIRRHTEACAQPLNHCHAQVLLAAKNFADPARRAEDWNHVRARKPMLIHEITDDFGRTWWPPRPLAFLICSDQARLRCKAGDVGRIIGSHQLVHQGPRPRK